MTAAAESRKRRIERAPERPPDAPPARDNIPTELLSRDRWVAWRWWRKHRRWTKLPLDPRTLKPAKTNDPATWGSFDEALDGLRRGVAAGVGFVFAAGDGLVGVDLDDCRDPATGALTPFADDLVLRCRTYAEVS